MLGRLEPVCARTVHASAATPIPMWDPLLVEIVHPTAPNWHPPRHPPDASEPPSATGTRPLTDVSEIQRTMVGVHAPPPQPHPPSSTGLSTMQKAVGYPSPASVSQHGRRQYTSNGRPVHEGFRARARDRRRAVAQAERSATEFTLAGPAWRLASGSHARQGETWCDGMAEKAVGLGSVSG